jgi:hypothetical protein
MTEPPSLRGLLGATGLWTIQLEGLPSSALRETVQEIEALGWPALWIPETFGREALSASTPPAERHRAARCRHRHRHHLGT